MSQLNPSAAQWDARYAEAEYAYGRQPNQFFAAQLDALPPGRILLPAEGEGRNAAYAVSRGWTVQAVDFSAEGRAKAFRLLEELGLPAKGLTYNVADILAFEDQLASYDAVAAIFAHLPPEHHAGFLAQYAGYVRPGGVFLLEAYRPEHMQQGLAGGPRDPAWAYSAAQLADAFAGWEIPHNQSASKVLSEGQYHQGPSLTVEFVARKPLV